MNCELECSEEDSKALSDAELALLMGIGSGRIPTKEKRINGCLICGQITPNSGPFCTVCQITFGQSRDGLVR
jgi:hypothetical protein